MYVQKNSFTSTTALTSRTVNKKLNFLHIFGDITYSPGAGADNF